MSLPNSINSLPSPRGPLVDKQGNIQRDWQLYFDRLFQAIPSADELLEAALTLLPPEDNPIDDWQSNTSSLTFAGPQAKFTGTDSSPSSTDSSANGNTRALPILLIDKTATGLGTPWGIYCRIKRSTTTGTGGAAGEQDTVGGFFMSSLEDGALGSGLWGINTETHFTTPGINALGYGIESNFHNNAAAPAAAWWSDVNANSVSTSKWGIASTSNGGYGLTASFLADFADDTTAQEATNGNRPLYGLLIKDALTAGIQVGSAEWAAQNSVVNKMTVGIRLDPVAKGASDRNSPAIRFRSWDQSQYENWDLLVTQSTTNSKLSFQFGDGASPSMSEKASLAEDGSLAINADLTAKNATLEASNAGLEMGAKGSANTPFIDFNSSGNSNDYDARLQASGGTGASGNGVLTLTGKLAVSGGVVLTGATPTVTAGQIGLGNSTAATATNGTGEAMKANVEGYLVVDLAGTNVKVPYVKV